MKKKRIMIFSLLVLFVVLLTITKPPSSSFDKWLSNKYSIECQGKECVLDSNNYKVIDSNIDNYFLFNKVGVKLEGKYESYLLVEGIGVLGGFVPFTYDARSE
ncbi:hypothetical protein E1I69_14265 [Bacillus timonensis]|uniref:Uncharacterized protein n=1 Tax=Bacillus timonensis TaxID=1033734 RepID=A0A4V3V7I8_9BACI|nr:hypothetical protein [Bacillus timonensis]THE11613.1 hypothetical protein E1I69_14265 [Bacillus timonensis]